MSGEPTQYEINRSHGDHRLFVICHADRFYDDVPPDIIRKGPWRSHRGLVVNLDPTVRLALARDRYVVHETAAAMWNPETQRRDWPPGSAP